MEDREEDICTADGGYMVRQVERILYGMAGREDIRYGR